MLISFIWISTLELITNSYVLFLTFLLQLVLNFVAVQKVAQYTVHSVVYILLLVLLGMQKIFLIQNSMELWYGRI